MEDTANNNMTAENQSNETNTATTSNEANTNNETTPTLATENKSTETTTTETVSTEKQNNENEEKKSDNEAEKAEEIKYEDFKLPEGMEYNKENAEAFKSVAKELGLKQEQAQKLVDYQAELVKNAQKQMEEQNLAWKQESEKVHGKTGVEQANRVLATVANEEFVEFLNQSGLGNHPAMIGVFKELYGKIGESSFVDRNSSGNVSLRNDYSNLYPSMKNFKK